jgi:4-diphosphocytidyl-2-C-methyl-D-erythritol kinase
MTTDPTRRLTPVVRLAPAKLNLTLAVLGRRPDGFHDLHSVMVPLALADRLSLAIVGGSSDGIRVEGTVADWPAERDLVLRAVAATRRAVGPPGSDGGTAPRLAVRLEKHIPVAAGLGGGSSDAAAAIDGSLEAWGTELEHEARHRVAIEIGSDVPFFLAGGPALVEGRGERVSALPGPSGTACGVLLVTPAVAVPTADVFAAHAAAAGGTPGSRGGQTRLASQHLADELRAGLSTVRLLERAGVLAVSNDLLAAASAVVPDLVSFRRALFRVLGRPIGLSGSGPTLWALYPSREVAEAAAEVVRRAIEDGALAAPGATAPVVIATTFADPPYGVGREDR